MRRWVVDQWNAIREQYHQIHSRQVETLQGDSHIDIETSGVLVIAALSLTLQHYAFTEMLWLAEDIPGLPVGWRKFLQRPENVQIVLLGCRTFGDLLCYVAIPCVWLKLAVRRPLVDYGLKWSHWKSGLLYAGMFAFMLPAIVIASRHTEFQATYPFYRLDPEEPVWPRLILWELMYAAQFVGLEFFFRGFLVHGTAKRLGIYSIFVMMIPYCMIHYGKPWPETCGAVIAGLVLGWFSLTTRSIYYGAALHIAVAWSMDAAALAHRTQQ